MFDKTIRENRWVEEDVKLPRSTYKKIAKNINVKVKWWWSTERIRKAVELKTLKMLSSEIEKEVEGMIKNA